MPISAPLQSSFEGGEISPLMYGRVDNPRYKSSLALCKNWLPMIQGSLARRSGTNFVGLAKNTGNPPRLIPFSFSTTQSYILEFGYDNSTGGYVRFWANYGLVEVSSTPVEIAHPYSLSEIPQIKYTQNADVLYLVHPNHPPLMLQRFSPTDWQFAYATLIDGPYGNIVPLGAMGIGMLSNGLSGSVTVEMVTFGSTSVTGTTSASGVIQLTVSSTAGLSTGQVHTVSGVGGTTEANGTWVITVIDATHINLNDSVYANAYTSGGSVSASTNAIVLGAANNGAGLVRLTIGSTLGMENCSYIIVSGVGGTTEANGIWSFTVIDGQTIDLQGSAFVHTYTSGGKALITPYTGSDYVLGSPYRAIRLQDINGVWAWGYIEGISFSSGSIVVSAIVRLQTPLSSYIITACAMGIYHPVNTAYFGDAAVNWPSNTCFHQDRLVFSGSPAFPERIDASNTSDYLNFAPTASDGTSADNNAFSFSLNANDVNQLEWMMSDPRGLLAGSVSSEWDMIASTAQVAITPTNVNLTRQSKWGSAPNINAFLVGICTLFVQRGARKLRELNYQWLINGYYATDLTEVAEHITGSGVVDMAYQSIPISVVWLVRNDGALIGCTYSRDMQTLSAGWHQHVLGGNGDDSGNPPFINSIAVIPDPTGVKDDLWMSVARSVNGVGNTYCIEYMNKIFEDIDDYRFATFMDSVQTYDNPLSITAITNASPCHITVPSHGLSTGDQVRLDSIVGIMTGNLNPPPVCAPKNPLNGKFFTITVVDSNNFTIAYDTTALTPFKSGGYARKMITTVTGLTAKEGETVSILADGAVQPNQVVSNTGTITLQQPAGTVLVGYCYNSQAQLLRLEAGSRNGTSIGKTRRTHRLGVMVHRSGPGLLVGPNFTTPDPVLFRTENQDLDGYSVGLYSGILSENVDFNYDFDNQICLTANNPLPCLISAIMPMLETQDRL